MRTLLSIVLALLVAPTFAQEKFYGSNIDTRIGMAFKANDAAVRKLLPAGWEPSPATTGPSQGANITLSLVNMQTNYDADGKPTTPYRGVAVTVPAKKTGSSDAAVPMVSAGIFTSNYAPGAYGVFVPGQISITRKISIGLDGKTTVDETWQLRADGQSIDIHVQFVAGTPANSKTEQKIYSAAKPDFFRIYRVEQASEVVRSVPQKVDRVTKVSFKAKGGKLGAIFDGKEQLISVTSIPWYSRQVSLPAL